MLYLSTYVTHVFDTLLPIQIQHTRLKGVVCRQLLVSNKCTTCVYSGLMVVVTYFSIHFCLQLPTCCEAYQKLLMPFNFCYDYMSW